MSFVKKVLLLSFILLSFLTITPQKVEAIDGQCNFTVNKTVLTTNDTLVVSATVDAKQDKGDANPNNEPAYSAYIRNDRDSKKAISTEVQRSKPASTSLLTFNLDLKNFVGGAATVGIYNPSGDGYTCHYNNTDQQTTTVQVSDANNPQRTLTITTSPSSPVTEPIKTMSSITIYGLESNKTYQLTMAGPNGSHGISHPGPNNNDWPTNGGSNINISNMCENGNSERNDCSVLFKDGTYNINVIDKDLGKNIGFATFGINAGSKGGAGIAGRNPCADNNGNVTECKTALGNIPVDPSAFISTILKIAIGVAGGIALIFMVIGAIQILTSSGDQKKLTDGREKIVAAVAGLLFLIFSVLILRFIGSNLLGGRVPGL